MEYWNDVEHKKIKIILNPLFHHERKVAPDGLKTLHFVSTIPSFQLRSEAELSSQRFVSVYSMIPCELR